MSTTRWRIHRLDVTASTNDDARSAAEVGEAEGYVVTAQRQLSGRGRQGRVWESPVGNLYASVLLRPKHMPQSAGFYSFVAALAVADAVSAALDSLPLAGRVREGGAPLGVPSKTVNGSSVRVVTNFKGRSCGTPPSLTLPARGRGRFRSVGGQLSTNNVIALKWPNDVLVQGKKISGILLEVTGDALIIGIGLNIAHYPGHPLYPTTSLHAEGAGGVVVEEILTRLLDRLAYWHDRMQTEGFAPIRAAWLAQALRGKLTVRLPQETLQGDFVDIDAQGHLRLLLEDGRERSISTGDVFLPPGT